MPTTRHASAGILADQHAAKREEIVALLTRAYWMEMETVMSYLANSKHLDGIRAENDVAEADCTGGEKGGQKADQLRERFRNFEVHSRRNKRNLCPAGCREYAARRSAFFTP